MHIVMHFFHARLMREFNKVWVWVWLPQVHDCYVVLSFITVSYCRQQYCLEHALLPIPSSWFGKKMAGSTSRGRYNVDIDATVHEKTRGWPVKPGLENIMIFSKISKIAYFQYFPENENLE